MMYLTQHTPQAPVNSHDSLTARQSSASRGGGRTHRRPNNSGSALLTEAENANLFGAIGSERVSLAAGVAQLLQGEGRQWRKVHVGVALLIKDYERRVYGLWMIDLFNGRQLWEQVLYKNFRATYYAKCPRFLSFEGDTAVYGLSFSDTTEADNFKAHLDKRAAGESQNRRGSIAPGSAGPSKQPTPPRLGGPHQGGSNKVTPMMPAMGGGGGGITTLGAVHPMHHISTGGAGERSVKSGKAPEKKAAGKKGGKPKLRKEDIGNPTEFKHLAHVGWNANEGSDVQVMEGEPMDATVRELLQAAGHNPDKMKKGDLKFAYQWLDEIGFDPKQPLPAPAQGGPPPGFEAVPGVTLRPATTGGIGRATPAACHMGGGGARAVPPPRPPPMATGPPLGRPLPQPPSQHVTVVAAPPVQPHYYIQDGHHPAPTVPPAAPTNATMKRPPPPAPPSQPPTVNGGGGVGNLAPMAAASSVPPPPPPPPPQLLMSGAGGSAPPPPPPPGQEMKPALGGGGGASRPPPPQQAPSANLLQQIQAGAKLRRVEVDPGRAPVPTNPPTSRDQMMKQIQQGAQLKHVDPTEVEENRKSGTGLQSFDGIAGALARALEERRRNMMQGDDTDDDDSDNGGANNDSEWEDE